MDAERWQRLSPLLDALLELESGPRETHLQSLRKEDPPLAAELERLLALEANDAAFLTDSIFDFPVGACAGARFGAYRLERLLGEGGMGQVWLAARADGLYQRKVALKLLRPGLADPRLRQRFDREREILARFSHPHIARLLDAGIDDGGQPYLALEYVEGEPLTEWCRSRQLDIATRLDLFRQVCDAVSHAHASLIVHRDLKPSNILVTPAGDVRLLDFGIAKLLDGEPKQLEQTKTGMRTFTLHYAAPEQIRGEPVTTMTDVYSLGVVLYELLTDSKPYRLKRQTDAEWEEAILDGEPLRPSQAVLHAESGQALPYSPARLSRELAGDLDNIALKALAKLPQQRYVSAEALSQDLLCYLRGQPVSARGESLAYRARKYLYRHRWMIAACVAVLAVLSTALGVVGWQAQRALHEAARAQAMQRYIADLFQDAGSSPNTPIDLRSLLDMGILRSEQSLARQPQARAELYGVVAQLRLGLGDYREADELLQRQARLLAVLPNAPASLQIEAATLRGRVRLELGEAQSCVAQMQPLAAMAKDQAGSLSGPVSAYFLQLGRCQRELERGAQAAGLFARALNLRRGSGDDAGIAETMLEQSILQADGGKPEQALKTLQGGLTLLRQKLGDRHPLAVEMLRMMCVLERNRDALNSAVRDCRAALKLAQALHGRNHRAVIDAKRQLAALYVDLGRFSEAESILLECAAWMRARLDAGHPELAQVLGSLGVVAWEDGDLQRALRFQQQAVQAWRKSGNAGLLAGGLFNLAMILHDAGRDREALPLVQEAGALRRHQFGAQHAVVGDNDRLLGEVLAALQDVAAARAALEDAVRLTKAGYGPTHSHTRRAEVELAWFQLHRGDAEARLRLLAQAQIKGADLEQRKVSWLARAYATQPMCLASPLAATRSLDTLLVELQLALPEGGALTRKLQKIRSECDMQQATTAAAPARVRSRPRQPSLS